MEIINVKNLSMNYGGNTVLKNISFSLNKGDYLCVIGENGTGKSTLLKGILGLEKASGGNIKITNRGKSKNIGYLPQQSETDGNFPCLVKEVIFSGFLNKKRFFSRYSKEDKLAMGVLAKKFDIFDLLDIPFSSLSGGQQQKVMLVRALCASEDFLLLDEPASFLDAETTKIMYQELKDLNTNGTTIIMVTHDTQKALEYASHILYIGNTDFFGTKDEYLKYIGGNVLDK